MGNRSEREGVPSCQIACAELFASVSTTLYKDNKPDFMKSTSIDHFRHINNGIIKDSGKQPVEVADQAGAASEQDGAASDHDGAASEQDEQTHNKRLPWTDIALG